MTDISPIPTDRPRFSSYIVVRDASAAIAFYARIFGAHELFRLTEPSGKVGHAELELAGGRLMLADEYPDFGALSPPSLGGTPVSLHLYVSDVDAVTRAAEAAGASVLRAPKDEFYGDRTAMIADPFGHKWHLSSQVELVSPAEMQRRFTAMFT